MANRWRAENWVGKKIGKSPGLVLIPNNVEQDGKTGNKGNKGEIIRLKSHKAQGLIQ